jgi:hypothetical protein
VRGLSDADISALAAALDGVVQENLGMAMVYQVVTAAQEWLAARLQQRAGPDPEAERRREEAEEEARHAALRAHGTPVTAESFAAWRKRFEAEAAAAAAAGDGKGGGGGGDGREGRLTGKAWFLKQVAAGEVVSGSEEEEGEEGDYEPEEEDEARARAAEVGDDEDGDDSDYEESSEGEDDDDEMLESYLAAKAR